MAISKVLIIINKDSTNKIIDGEKLEEKIVRYYKYTKYILQNKGLVHSIKNIYKSVRKVQTTRILGKDSFSKNQNSWLLNILKVSKDSNN